MRRPVALLLFVLATQSLSPVVDAGVAPGQLCGGPGDFNNDGADDLAVGVPRIGSAGSVIVLYGSGSGVQVDDPPSQDWRQGQAGLAGTAGGTDEFGAALAHGDFNGDSYDDLAVGVPEEAVATGSVHVIYGSATGLQATSPDDQRLTVASPGVQGSTD